MENSNTVDYVTEKVWDAFAAGCVPVYEGAPNAIKDFLPHPKSIIHVSDYATPAALHAEIKRVLTNETLWFEHFVGVLTCCRNEYVAWRSMPLEQLSSGYRNLLSMLDVSQNIHSRCQMCQILSKEKYGE